MGVLMRSDIDICQLFSCPSCTPFAVRMEDDSLWDSCVIGLTNDCNVAVDPSGQPSSVDGCLEAGLGEGGHIQ